MGFIYNDKKTRFAFVIDYSLGPDGQCVVYEVQRTISDNFRDEFDSNTDSLRNKMEPIWIKWAQKQYQNSFVLDIAIELNDKKALQRRIISQDPRTEELNPKYIVLQSRDDREESAKKIKNFFGQCKIVFKSNGACGLGNIFVDLCADNWKEQIDAAIEKCKTAGPSYVVEEQIMYPPLPEDCARFPGQSQLGVYYRDMIIFDPDTQTVEFIEVYKNILNTIETTDSHHKKRSGNLEETAYLLRYRPDELQRIVAAKRNLHPEFYKSKEAVFTSIGQVMFEYTLREQPRSLRMLGPASILPSKYFFNWFHTEAEGEWAYYQYFLQLSESKGRIPTSSPPFTVSEIELPELKSLSNKSKQDFLYYLNDFLKSSHIDFDNKRLLYLYCALQHAQYDKNAVFRSLWQKQSFFYHGDDKEVGNQALKVIEIHQKRRAF